MQVKILPLENKVVVITGGGTGIGKACAYAFSRNGFDVVIAGRNIETLQDTANDLKNGMTKVHLINADISIEGQCAFLIAETIKIFGRIDVLINNAGVSMRAAFNEVDLKVLHTLMDINFWGTVYCTKYALPYLLKSNGSLVGISSIAGKKGLPGRTGYCASKFAMEGFLETIRIENIKRNLHVMVACPGFTNTDIRKHAYKKDGSLQVESPRDEAGMMTPEEVADKIYKGYIRKKRDLIMTTEGKFTLWINKFFPGWMDKIVYNHMAKEPDSPFT